MDQQHAQPHEPASGAVKVSWARCKNIIGGVRCDATLAEHPYGRCPRDQSREMKVKGQPPTRVSTSLSAEEVIWLDAVLAAVDSGRGVHELARQPIARRVADHVTAMKRTLHSKQQKGT